MLFNLEKCLIMHSGFERTGVERQIVEVEKNKKDLDTCRHAEGREGIDMQCMQCSSASQGESSYPCTSKFRGCILTAFCKHRGRMNVQRKLTKILFISFERWQRFG